MFLPVALVLFSLTVDAGPGLAPLPSQQADVPWPTQEWPTGKAVVSSPEALEKLLGVTRAVSPTLGETRAVVVIQGGRLVAEAYMPGYGPQNRLLSWSIAKSVTQAWLGIAVRDHLVDLDKPMGNPRWRAADPRAAISWRHWINMVDGQDYREIGYPDPVTSDAAKMLFGAGRNDVAGYGAALPLIHAPGTFWNYNSAGLNLIADALGRVFAPAASPLERRAKIASVLKRELFDPIGMSSAQPEFDATGNFVGSAFFYATARDYARFGLLYLRDGVWDRRRILPEGWVDFARTRNPADNSDEYGAGWWVTPSSGPGKPYPALAAGGPADVFVAQGFKGQLIVVVPSKDLIVVRLGLLDDLHHFRDLGAWARALVALFPDVAR